MALDSDWEAVFDIMGNNDDWLESTTTLVDLIEEDRNITEPASLIKRAPIVKYRYAKEGIETVLEYVRTTPLAVVFCSLVWSTNPDG